MLHEPGDDRLDHQISLAVIVVGLIAHRAAEVLDAAGGFRVSWPRLNCDWAVCFNDCGDKAWPANAETRKAGAGPIRLLYAREITKTQKASSRSTSLSRASKHQTVVELMNPAGPVTKFIQLSRSNGARLPDRRGK